MTIWPKEPTQHSWCEHTGHKTLSCDIIHERFRYLNWRHSFPEVIQREFDLWVKGRPKAGIDPSAALASGSLHTITDVNVRTGVEEQEGTANVSTYNVNYRVTPATGNLIRLRKEWETGFTQIVWIIMNAFTYVINEKVLEDPLKRSTLSHTVTVMFIIISFSDFPVFYVPS